MKLATFETGNERRIGLVVGDDVLDLTAADARLPRDMLALLDMEAAGMAAVALAAQSAPAIPLRSVRLCVPVMPRKLMALGINYREHIAEMQARLPDFVPPSAQVWFNKQVTAVTGPFDDMHKPKVSDMFDYEGELAVIIGRRCRHVSVEDAPAVILGYAICNDGSVRDWQMATPTQTMGKSFDTHAPIGPWITTSDEVSDPQALQIQVYVNGETRQNFNTADMVFSCYEQVAHLSKAMTLEPGDIIITGTSIGNGALREPQIWLKPGDSVRVEIDGLGHIENKVIAEPEHALFQR